MFKFIYFFALAANKYKHILHEIVTIFCFYLLICITIIKGKKWQEKLKIVVSNAVKNKCRTNGSFEHPLYMLVKLILVMFVNLTEFLAIIIHSLLTLEYYVQIWVSDQRLFWASSLHQHVSEVCHRHKQKEKLTRNVKNCCLKCCQK